MIFQSLTSKLLSLNSQKVIVSLKLEPAQKPESALLLQSKSLNYETGLRSERTLLLPKSVS